MGGSYQIQAEFKHRVRLGGASRLKGKQMHKKIDMAMYSILKAYAARVYKSKKAKAVVQCDQAEVVKGPLSDRTCFLEGEQAESNCDTQATQTNEKTAT
jgi:hypothetical protein